MRTFKIYFLSNFQIYNIAIVTMLYITAPGLTYFITGSYKGSLCVNCSVMSHSLWPHGLYVAQWAPLSMGFPRKEYWIGLPFPSPGDLLDPEIKLVFLASPALAGRFFTIVPPGKPMCSLPLGYMVTAFSWSPEFPQNSVSALSVTLSCLPHTRQCSL